MESLEDYDVGRRLGKGAYGTVYIATKKKGGDVACVKKLEFCPGQPPVGESLFEREVKALGAVQHPNIVKVLWWGREDARDGGEVGYRPWILLEYCSQGSLKGFIDRAKEAKAARLDVDEKQVVQWVRDVLSALKELHSRGIMHRDLKPDNVVVHASGVAKVCDFGIAASSEHTRHTHAGTDEYMAPQIVYRTEDKYKADADMFSVGVMVLEMFTLSRIPDAQAQGGDRSTDISKLLYLWYVDDVDIAMDKERDLHDDVRATLQRRVSRQWSEAVSKLVVGCLRYSRDVRLTSERAVRLLGPGSKGGASAVVMIVGSETGRADQRLDGRPSDPVRRPQEAPTSEDRNTTGLQAQPSTHYQSAAARDDAPQYCDVCDKPVMKGNWDEHCAGRAHVKKLAAAAAADAAPLHASAAAAGAETPQETVASPSLAATASAAATAGGTSPPSEHQTSSSSSPQPQQSGGGGGFAALPPAAHRVSWSGYWDEPCAGRAHMKKVETAAPAAPAAADAPPSHAGAAAGAETPQETAPPAAVAVSPAPRCTLRLQTGELWEEGGPVVLKQFAGDTVDVFVCGEDTWRLPEELRGGVGVPEDGVDGVVRGVRCAVSMLDRERWGCTAAPGRVPTLVPDRGGVAPGVAHTVAKATLAACCETLKKGHLLRLACFEPRVDGGGGARTVACFVMKEPGMTEDEAASTVAKARGSEGPNYDLLCRMLHEYERRGWGHTGLESLKKNVERRVVGWK